jgi:hypothetical protein
VSWGYFTLHKSCLTTDCSIASRSPTENIGRIISELCNALPPVDPQALCFAVHDGKVHNPLGAGSYIFEKVYVPSLVRFMDLPLDESDFTSRKRATTSTAIIHIGAQPNNSPHAGTIIVFALAFLIARDIKKLYEELRKGDISEEFKSWIDDIGIEVRLDLVDTAPDNRSGCFLQGIAYQRSQRHTQAYHSYLPDYEEIMRSAADFVGGDIPYKIFTQENLTTMPSIPRIINAIVKDRKRLGNELAPVSHSLAMRCACPHQGCGLAEKHGRMNKYLVDASGVATISFHCPDHGDHTITTSNPADVGRLEFNTPLRNLVRAEAFGIHTINSREAAHNALAVGEGEKICEYVHMRVTGSDYAGMYSEQLLFRQLPLLSASGLGAIPTPVIAYAPLVLDWAGSKLSKSLYVKEGAYKYLQEAGMGYLLSFADMKESGRDHRILFGEVARWLEDPKKLFRSYTVNYLHRVFEDQRCKDTKDN